jgi:pimeloyl-ACP methyl ester carboxylesterase
VISNGGWCRLFARLASVTIEDPIAAGVTHRRHQIEVDDGVRLTVDEWQPGTGAEPLVFVAGWVSIMEGWRPLLEVLARERPVYYMETREKRSAVFERSRLRPVDFAIPVLGDDVIAVCDQLAIDPHLRVFFASSMGSNAVLEAFKYGRLEGKAAFLIGPNAEFRFPGWGKALVLFPTALYRLLLPLVLWYLRHFRVNVREDPQQMARYRRTLKAAHTKRLKLSARAVIGYSLFPGLETVEVPVAVAYAASDTLHEGDDVHRIVGVLPRGRAVECPSNTYMHTASVAADLQRFLATL